MKLLVVGAGGREHAIIRKLRLNKRVETIYCIPGNAGISKDAICPMPDTKAADIAAIVDFAEKNRIDFAVVAPDDPLVLGMTDALAEKGIPSFGPRKAAAAIEGSKVFSKGLMQKYGIPTAEYKAFTNQNEAVEYIEKQGRYPVVIKADGLALGKGVVIAADFIEAAAAVKSMMEDRIFGDSGSEIVIEEFLTGPEVTVLAFTDGKTIAPMASSMDHKRAFDGNLGPNTGGMGTIAPNPHYTSEIADRCMREIFMPTIKAMRAENRIFKGCLYFGLILTPDGPKVIEYNCRFGDPEAQVVLELLESDLLEIMLAIDEDRLAEIPIYWKDEHAACVVLASGGYPGKYPTGIPIYGLDEDGQVDGATVYHAGTRLSGEGFATSGGRVLGVTVTAATLEDALDKAYSAAGAISFEGMRFRRDIGKYIP